MNKYITVLLVVLAATGVEAQDCQSALKIALGDVGIEDLSRQQAFTGVGQEILSVLEAFKQMKDDEEVEPAQSKAVYTADRTDRFPAASTSYSDIHQEQQLFLPNPSLTTGIQIRAPSPAA
ncbi:hypothetical protein [Prevotella denticola]|jgi:hypothetical protein|uniref:hypothetical protein n=1 Tax=Prevotella denticola TaxID=28129 RepID=UPI00020131BA|nr:hypothetical protein [Prevotella denticola]AEA21451.1 hypothetical protein HMPREF9137_0184 [Prevotella denticola F0289]AXV50177.1 hypothetical protein DYJ25_10165 [Prevotella denticola]KGF42932.1 hypothetical protein HMPREF2139_01830 [Prevotella denticola DNF00960]MBW4758448.1 hypothetical protein [Prevotella denticola]MBW4898915.1 hypothetical protein [Prevotella denticola]